MYSIAAVLVLDADGERIASKFYTEDLPTVKEQRTFEKNLWNKTYRANGMLFSDACTKRRQEKKKKNAKQKLKHTKPTIAIFFFGTAEIIMYENVVAVYKCAQDCYFYVLGNYDENELILLSALQCLTDAMSRLLRGQLDKRTLLENLDFLLLAIDELTDDGILLECDGIQLAQRVSMKSENDVPLSEQTVSQALRTARSKLEDVVLK
jgi:hypothetical protein